MHIKEKDRLEKKKENTMRTEEPNYIFMLLAKWRKFITTSQM